MTKIDFTIFTPTYNRVHLLPRLFESLSRQSHRSFEWILVDDGSTDGTEEWVNEIREQSFFPIRYLRQENSGKYVAHNQAVGHARGRFFLSVDSDDWLVPEALERYLLHWSSIPEARRQKFAGVCALCADPQGRVIGTSYPFDVIDCTLIEIRTKYRMKGDKKEVFRTGIVKEYPYPRFEGEIWMPPSVVWYRIGEKYLTRFVNDVLVIKDYQREGISARGIGNIRRTISNAKGYRYFAREFIRSGSYIPPDLLILGYIRYIRFSLHARVKMRKALSEAPSKLVFVLAFLAGLILYYRDRIRLIAA
jgi:glycosyltransferase involved in cell wall biosynthesis